MSFRKFGFVNVCSLRSKLIVPEFIEFVNEYDMLACAETKLNSNIDSVSVTGYSYYGSKITKVSSKSGGVGVFVKDSIVDEFHVLDCRHHCSKCLLLCDVICYGF